MPASQNRWPSRNVEVRSPQILAGVPVLETSQKPLSLRKRGLVALGQLRFPLLLAGLRKPSELRPVASPTPPGPPAPLPHSPRPPSSSPRPQSLPQPLPPPPLLSLVELSPALHPPPPCRPAISHASDWHLWRLGDAGFFSSLSRPLLYHWCHMNTCVGTSTCHPVQPLPGHIGQAHSVDSGRRRSWAGCWAEGRCACPGARPAVTSTAAGSGRRNKQASEGAL